MTVSRADHPHRTVYLIVPLVLVIIAALIWSGFATYHHAESPKVPGYIAWTLIAVLDGTVVVTTPVWLSTILDAKIRNYAAVICVAALGGSMAINYAETGWLGVFPPLIAALLIHLVGVVLRALARTDGVRGQSVEDPVVDADSELVPTPVRPAADVQVTVAPRPLTLAPPPPPGDDEEAAGTAAGFARSLLDDAFEAGEAIPGGAAITKKCRAAGFSVNDNYGRSFRSKWLGQNPEAREAVDG